MAATIIKILLISVLIESCSAKYIEAELETDTSKDKVRTDVFHIYIWYDNEVYLYYFLLHKSSVRVSDIDFTSCFYARSNTAFSSPTY